MHEFSSILAGPTLDAPAPVQQRGTLAQVVEHFRQAQSRMGTPNVAGSFSQVAAVYSCVRAKADAAAKLLLMTATSDGQVIENGPMVELSECPNPKMTGRTFWRLTSAFLDLFGRCHWHITADAIGRPVTVLPINPLQMKPEIDRNTGELRGWKFRAAGALRGLEEFIPVDEVWTITDPDLESPDRPYEGLSPRFAAMRAISQYLKSDIANEASLNNGVEPGGAFQVEGNLSDAQKKDIKAELIDKHAGALNRRTFMLLEGGMKFVPIPTSYADAEFVELKKMSRVDICAAFGVPPAVIGYYEDSNYAHAESAEQGFWIRTVLPRGEWLAEEWTNGILARFKGDRSLAAANARHAPMPDAMKSYGPCRAASTRATRRDLRVYAFFDSSNVPAVQKAQLSLADQVSKWVTMGVPLNQALTTFGLPFKPVPWGDTWRVGIGTMDVRNDELPGAGDPNFTEPGEPGEPGSPADVEEGKGRRRQAGGDNVVEKIDKASEAALARLWLQQRASWQPLEKKMKGKVRKHFFAVGAAVLKKFDALADELGLPPAPAEGEKAVQQRNASIIGTILIEINVVKGKLVASVGPVIRESFRLGGEQSMQEAAVAQGKEPKDADPFNLKDPRIEAAMRRKLVRLAGVSDTVSAKVRDTIADGLANSETIAEVRDRIKHVFDMTDARATTIARTEIHGAVETARHEGRKQAGIPLKSWLWSRKAEGRALHQATEEATRAKPIPVDDEFTIAGTSITCMHPGSTGEPEHDINCSCVAISRFPDDSLKAVLARHAQHGVLTLDGLRALDEARAKR